MKYLKVWQKDIIDGKSRFYIAETKETFHSVYYSAYGNKEKTIKVYVVSPNIFEVYCENEEKLKAFSWLPREKCPQEVIGTIYKIPTFYTIFYERRIFDYKSCYIGNIGSSSIIRLDENGEQVLFV